MQAQCGGTSCVRCGFHFANAETLLLWMISLALRIARSVESAAACSDCCQAGHCAQHFLSSLPLHAALSVRRGCIFDRRYNTERACRQKALRSSKSKSKSKSKPKPKPKSKPRSRPRPRSRERAWNAMHLRSPSRAGEFFVRRGAALVILFSHGRLAQRLAQVLYTHKAGGSNPSSPTIVRETRGPCAPSRFCL